jgi:micrococcal nuclease
VNSFTSLSLWKKVGVIGVVLLFLGMLQSGSSRERAETHDTSVVPEAREESERVPEVATEMSETEIPLPRQNTDRGEDSREVSLYKVVRVVDGDTIDVDVEGVTERIRLIGIDTPESVDPRRPVECFGVEASKRAKELMLGKRVSLKDDPTQDNRDTHGRLLRYVFLESGEHINLRLIEEGYAQEYTYDLPYKYQRAFRDAEKDAELLSRGLWGPACENADEDEEPISSAVVPFSSVSDSRGENTSCTIKGNINSEGEKIYHTLGCNSYEKTKIDESKGEEWFCTENEAKALGWRKALNCN